jgi:hypothetical protein
MAESYRDLLSGALDAYMSVVGNRMNEIMKVLTIFSAVMLPLTFIAGVYGMNFDYIPELHKQYGYFAVWAIMLTVAVVMLSLFWRAGWIGGGGGAAGTGSRKASRGRILSTAIMSSRRGRGRRSFSHTGHKARHQRAGGWNAMAWNESGTRIMGRSSPR